MRTFLLAVSLLLASCHPGMKVELCNNTAQTLTVISADTESKETAYDVASKETVRIKVPYELRVVRHDGQTWRYEFPPKPLPEKFAKRLRGNWILHRFQLETDGAIHVLLPDSRTPAMILPDQPEGYPLQPR